MVHVDQLLSRALKDVTPEMERHKERVERALQKAALDQGVSYDDFKLKRKADIGIVLAHKRILQALPMGDSETLTMLFSTSLRPHIPQHLVDEINDFISVIEGGEQRFEQRWNEHNRDALNELPGSYARIKTAEVASSEIIELATAIKYTYEMAIQTAPDVELEKEKYKNELKEGTWLARQYDGLDFLGCVPSEILFQQARKIAFRAMQAEWAQEEFLNEMAQMELDKASAAFTQRARSKKTKEGQERQ